MENVAKRQNGADGKQTTRHPEVYRRIAWKGKTVGLYFTEIYTPPNTTLPGDVSLTLNMTANKQHVILRRFAQDDD